MAGFAVDESQLAALVDFLHATQDPSRQKQVTEDFQRYAEDEEFNQYLGLIFATGRGLEGAGEEMSVRLRLVAGGALRGNLEALGSDPPEELLVFFRDVAAEALWKGEGGVARMGASMLATMIRQTGLGSVWDDVLRRCLEVLAHVEPRDEAHAALLLLRDLTADVAEEMERHHARPLGVLVPQLIRWGGLGADYGVLRNLALKSLVQLQGGGFLSISGCVEAILELYWTLLETDETEVLELVVEGLKELFDKDFERILEPQTPVEGGGAAKRSGVDTVKTVCGFMTSVLLGWRSDVASVHALRFFCVLLGNATDNWLEMRDFALEVFEEALPAILACARASDVEMDDFPEDDEPDLGERDDLSTLRPRIPSLRARAALSGAGAEEGGGEEGGEEEDEGGAQSTLRAEACSVLGWMAEVMEEDAPPRVIHAASPLLHGKPPEGARDECEAWIWAEAGLVAVSEMARADMNEAVTEMLPDLVSHIAEVAAEANPILRGSALLCLGKIGAWIGVGLDADGFAEVVRMLKRGLGDHKKFVVCNALRGICALCDNAKSLIAHFVNELLQELVPILEADDAPASILLEALDALGSLLDNAPDDFTDDGTVLESLIGPLTNVWSLVPGDGLDIDHFLLVPVLEPFISLIHASGEVFSPMAPDFLEKIIRIATFSAEALALDRRNNNAADTVTLSVATDLIGVVLENCPGAVQDDLASSPYREQVIDVLHVALADRGKGDAHLHISAPALVGDIVRRAPAVLEHDVIPISRLLVRLIDSALSSTANANAMWALGELITAFPEAYRDSEFFIEVLGRLDVFIDNFQRLEQDVIVNMGALIGRISRVDPDPLSAALDTHLHIFARCLSRAEDGEEKVQGFEGLFCALERFLRRFGAERGAIEAIQDAFPTVAEAIASWEHLDEAAFDIVKKVAGLIDEALDGGWDEFARRKFNQDLRTKLNDVLEHACGGPRPFGQVDPEDEVDEAILDE